nr:protein tyrosine phosphatase family protein [Armatimonas sp.]
MLHRIRNFLWLDDNLGTSGLVRPEQLDWIADAGFVCVINLLPDESDAWFPEEPGRVGELGMEFVRIPVIWLKPTRENFETFCIAMNERKDKKLFVHCAANMRASAFLYLWRLRNGYDESEALDDLHDIWEPDGVWAEFIETNRP